MRHESRANRSDEWFTPPEIIGALGAFDLDPCGSARQPWTTARQTLTATENGLAGAWSGRVWLNPPYGEQTARWLARLADHGNGIALVFARTETRMFFDSVWGKAAAALFLRSRLKFWSFNNDGQVRPGDRSPAPSVLLAYGTANAEILRRSGLDGFFVDLGPDRTWIGWRAVVRRALYNSIPLGLPEIYRIVQARIHRPTNRNVEAKIRQTLYTYNEFRRTTGNRWALSETAQ